jgi:uncharacterized protein YcnI
MNLADHRRNVFLAALCACLVARGASAHVTVWPQQSQPGAIERYTVRVPTEEDVPTTSVELEVPADVRFLWMMAAPVPNAYTYELVRENGRVARIIWKQDIKPNEVSEFVFFVFNPPTAGTITWRARQRFSDGRVVDWMGPPTDRRPASIVTLALPSEHSGTGHLSHETQR